MMSTAPESEGLLIFKVMTDFIIMYLLYHTLKRDSAY